jgi:hypothetical protein
MATEQRITAACGGGNSSRTRPSNVVLQGLANRFGLRLHIRHFPPGTSKWNKFEHRVFDHIKRSRPLTGYAVIVQLIDNTTTAPGLTPRAEVDENKYPTKKVIINEQPAEV